MYWDQTKFIGWQRILYSEFWWKDLSVTNIPNKNTYLLSMNSYNYILRHSISSNKKVISHWNGWTFMQMFIILIFFPTPIFKILFSSLQFSGPFPLFPFKILPNSLIFERRRYCFPFFHVIFFPTVLVFYSTLHNLILFTNTFDKLLTNP